MYKKQPTISFDTLMDESKGALAILGRKEATKEAIETALTAVRKAILRKQPSISAKDIVYTVSELSKHCGEGDQHTVAGIRMRMHLVRRGELTTPKPIH